MKSHKIVYGIVAYKDIEAIKYKVESLYSEEDYFIIHWNKLSCKKELKELKEIFKDKKNVYVYSKYRVIWGHISILYVMIENMKKSLELALNFEHFISLSQQTMPVKKISYIKEYLSKYKDKSVLSIKQIKYIKNKVSIGSHYYYLTNIKHRNNLNLSLKLKGFIYILFDFIKFFPLIIRDKTISLRDIKKETEKELQDVLTSNKSYFRKRKRFYKQYLLNIFLFPLTFNPDSISGDRTRFYKRPEYNSNKYAFIAKQGTGPDIILSKDHILNILSQSNKKVNDFLKKCKHSFAPEELFFQTILMNEEDLNKNVVLKESMSIGKFFITNSNYFEINEKKIVEDCNNRIDILAKKCSVLIRDHFLDIKATPEDLLFLRKIEDIKIIKNLAKYTKI